MREIDQDISRAQEIVDEHTVSVRDYNTLSRQRVQNTLDLFEQIYKTDTARAGRLYKNAKAANAIADSVYLYLQKLKNLMAEKAGGWLDSNKDGVERDEDLEIAENYFVIQDGGKNGKELRQRLEIFENRMKSLLIDKDGNATPDSVKFDIDTREEFTTRDGSKKEWHEYYFEDMPAIAAITELTKFQNDVRNAQSEVTYYLYNQIK